MHRTAHKNQKQHKDLFTNLPDQLDMGFTSISQTNTLIFSLENPNDYPVSFHFDSSKFKISPDRYSCHLTYFRGQLGPQGKVQFSISFSPICAEVVISTVILNIENEKPRITKISGIGKYPFLQLNTSKLNFEQLLIGRKLTKEITIKNQSEVTAVFNIEKIIDDEFKDNAFVLDFTSGSIPSKSTFLIKVTYQPQIYGVVSVIRYKVNCSGGNDLFFECSGTASPFKVYLSEMSINFGEIKIGNTSSKLLTVHNDSELATSYQFYCDKGNIFSFSKTRGTVPVKGMERIIINFNPSHTINYYERVYCVTRNHQILYVDLIGTCYDLLIKPIPLQQHHINNFRRRVITGKLTEVDFRYMENSYIMKLNQMLGQNNSILEELENPQQGPVGNLQGEWAENANQTVLHKELMLEPKSEHKLIQFSEDFLDFGYQECMSESGPKEIEIHNKLNCKLTLFWSIQQQPTMNPEQRMAVFCVYPET